MSLKLNSSGGGSVTLQEPVTASTLTLNLPATSGTLVLDGGSPTFSALTVNGNNISAVNSMGFRNRIINGDMRIDQRNTGAAVTQSTSFQYTVDRFGVVGSVASKFTAQQSSLAATGFTNSLLCTSSSAYAVGASEDFSIRQYIEGLNVDDLAWGTASASSVTLSFWVRSSLTGTFGGSIANSAQDRFYVFSYTISAANTWEQKTITIAGDTTGTWLTTNGIGIRLLWSLGAGSTVSGSAGSWGTTFYRSATGAVSVVGTNGATLYITGVQLEAGTVATPFERIDYGRELMMCQRYCVLLGGEDGPSHAGSGVWYASTAAIYQMTLPVKMRAAPTLTNVSPTVTMYIGGSILTSTAPAINTSAQSSVEFYTPVDAGSTTQGNATSARYTIGKSLLTSEL
jgi:hypothetical protein